MAEWAERNGLERAALSEWERVLLATPEDDAARQRLRYVKRAGAWVRDDASLALLAPAVDSKPARAAEYVTKRRHDVERPAGARHRTVAARAFAAGLRDVGEAQLRIAIASDPGDVWSRIALGQVPDPDEGWVPAAVRARRVAAARAEADARRLRAIRTEPVGLAEPSARSATARTTLSVWRLREWRLETDLPSDDAAETLVAVDLVARWFREALGLEFGAPLLRDGGTFVVVSTEEAYGRLIAALPGLSSAEKSFAAGLSAYPLKHVPGAGPYEVVIQRPEGTSSADACLHYAVHFLAQAWCGVEAQEAWLYEGLAAYAAIRLHGYSGSWCVRLEDTSARGATQDFPDDPSDWPTLVDGLVRLRDDFPLKGLVGVSINGLDGPMLSKSWSILRWLFEQHRTEARAFLDARRGGATTAAALHEATGLSLDDLDAAWRLEVLAVGPE